jgi:hypothetical protein
MADIESWAYLLQLRWCRTLVSPVVLGHNADAVVGRNMAELRALSFTFSRAGITIHLSAFALLA